MPVDGESTGEEREGARPSFGGLSPAEAGKRSAEKRRERLASAAGSAQPESDEVRHLRDLAKGKGMVALHAMRDLRAIEERARQGTSDKAMLDVLTPLQRACIASTLRGDVVSQAQAIEAWCPESPAI